MSAPQADHDPAPQSEHRTGITRPPGSSPSEPTAGSSRADTEPPTRRRPQAFPRSQRRNHPPDSDRGKRPHLPRFFDAGQRPNPIVVLYLAVSGLTRRPIAPRRPRGPASAKPQLGANRTQPSLPRQEHDWCCSVTRLAAARDALRRREDSLFAKVLTPLAAAARRNVRRTTVARPRLLALTRPRCPTRGSAATCTNARFRVFRLTPKPRDPGDRRTPSRAYREPSAPPWRRCAVCRAGSITRIPTATSLTSLEDLKAGLPRSCMTRVDSPRASAAHAAPEHSR